MADKILHTIELEDGTTVELESDRNLSQAEVQAYLSTHTKQLAEAPVDLRETVESRLKPIIGPMAARAVENIGPYAAPLAGMAIGAVKGGALGSAGGPPGALIGSVLGAGMGGVAGQGINEAFEATRRLMESQTQRSPLEIGTNLGVSGLEGAGSQALFGLGGAALNRLRGPISSLAMSIAGQARSIGVPLTAAEQSGSPILQFAETYASRAPGGMGTFRRFGAKQAIKARHAGIELADDVAGPGALVDQSTRSNRFLLELQSTVQKVRGDEQRIFDRYLTLAGRDSVVDVDPLVQAANAIAKERPILKSLQNDKLNAVLTDLQKLDPLHKVRQALGLSAGAPLPPGVSLSGPTQQVTLTQLRNIRTELGKLAYPSRLEGTPQTDIPTAQARRLYEAVSEVLEIDAARKGPQVANALAEANQFFRVNVAKNLNSSDMYSSILSNEKNLAAFNSKLFDPSDAATLLDARAVMSPGGWKIIQQQWFDDALTGAFVQGEGGLIGFNGRMFAEKVQKNLPVLRNLFDPDTVDRIMDFAKVVRQAQRTSFHKESDWLGLVVGLGQFTAVSAALGNTLLRETSGAEQMAPLIIPVLPWVIGKLVTGPRTSQLVAQLFTPGSSARNVTTEITKTMGRGASRGMTFPDEASALESLSNAAVKVRHPDEPNKYVPMREAWDALKQMPAGDDIVAAQQLANELTDEQRAVFETAFTQFRDPQAARMTIPGAPRIKVAPGVRSVGSATPSMRLSAPPSVPPALTRGAPLRHYVPEG